MFKTRFDLSKLNPFRGRFGSRFFAKRAMLRDVKRRQRIEEDRVAEERRRFVALVETSMDYIGMATLDGKCFYLNPAGLALVGLKDLEELRQHQPIDFVADDYKPFFRETVLPALRAQGKWEGEMPLKHQKTGESIAASRTLFLLKHPTTGESLCIATVSRDIRERKRVEDALRESEARFRHLANAMPQLVWTATSDGIVDYYNAHVADYSPLVRSANGQWDWQQFLHPDDLPVTWKVWQTAVATGQPFEQSHRIRMADGNYRWHLSRAMPVRNASGCVVKWFGTATDIESQKQIEEQLTEADRHKDHFLAMLAHELRNPLAPIRNAAQILRTAGISEMTFNRANQIITRQVDHMTKLIDDLLDVSRIARGKMPLQFESLNLVEIIINTVEDHRSYIESGGIELALDTSIDDISISGDRTRLSQVIGNLLHNASKFTPAGGRITVQLTQVNDAACIIVSDTGIGMAEETINHIFETFMQADDTLERAKGGLGLGLALAKGIVELHSGKITAHSAGIGHGSEFIICLPILYAQDILSVMKINDVTLNHHERKKVLIIEDNKDAAESMQLLLEITGNDVKVALNGQEGLAAAQAFDPDIVVCDIGLPGMDGYAVAQAIKTSPFYRPNKRLIALTGYGQDEDKTRALQAGFDAHLTKPVNLDQLQKMMESRPS